MGGNIYPIGFKIYYGDYTSYSAFISSGNLKLLWDFIPKKDDVQVVVLFENTIDSLNRYTRMFYSGVDYYIFDGKKFTFGNILYDGTVLYGKWASDKDFRNIFNIAWNNYEFKKGD